MTIKKKKDEVYLSEVLDVCQKLQIINEVPDPLKLKVQELNGVYNKNQNIYI